MHDHAQRRPLPVRLTPAERAFYVELRRLVDTAGMSCKALEESTSAAKSDVGKSSFYSKSQWSRWLNGQSRPPRKAVRKLAEKLEEEGIEADHLVDLWGSAFVPAGYPQAPGPAADTVSDIERGGSDALHLAGAARADFEAAARDRAPVGRSGSAWAAPRTLPRDITPFTGRNQELRGPVDPATGADGPGGVVGIHTIGGMSAVPVPRELPADVAAFTGRAAELAELDQILLGGHADQAGDAKPAAAVISAVSGTAGVGKTALAIHWAHHAAAKFPGGQLYVNLRGYDPGQPVSAASALAGFLRALGVPGPDIPAEQTERAARYRSLLAGKQMLVVLDNASTVEQVRPLLPGTPGCAVLVTSRDSLAGLVARDGATRLDLDLLPLADAVALLAELTGARVAAEPDAAVTLARQCARLPLALRVAAELAAARPHVTLASLVTELAGQQRRLDLLHAAGDLATSVRAVFSWSYRQLTDQAARMFRLAGIYPCPDITAPAAASLTATAEADAGALLGELARAHLIAEHVPGRYALHDLLRAYAFEQAHHTDSQADRDAAIGRVLDHYLHTAARAAPLLTLGKEPVALAPPRPGAAAGQIADRRQALAWFEAEHQILLAAVTLAAGSGFDSHAWQLPWAMASFLQVRGHWQENATTQRTALAAATRLGDAAAQAISCRLLAMACTNLGDHDQALGHYADSLTLYQRLGNRHGEAKTHHNLGSLAARQGRYADALGHAEQALRLYQATSDKANEAAALNAVGWYHGMLGDYQQARAFCRQAVILCAETGYCWAEGNAWDSLGYAEHHLGNLAEAAACYQRALSLCREAGDRFYEADILTHLGDTRHAAGEPAQAREAWQQALAILDDIQHPDAGQVRAKLASTNDHASPNPSA
jgi:tetratricopeptide (TPR) repeat protein